MSNSESGSLRGAWFLRNRNSGKTDAPPETTPVNLFLRARALARAGDKDLAIRFLREASTLDPNFSDAIETHGEVLDTSGAFAPGAALYDQARDLRRKVRRGAPDRHFVMRQRGPMVSEISAYSAVIKSLKNSALPLLARGNAYLVDRQPEAALADFEKALKLKPGLPDVLVLKAEALAMMGRQPAAVELLDQALAAIPRDPGALNTRGILRMASGRVDEANADWRLQLELVHGRPAPSAYLALRLADYETAIPYLEAARQADPLDPYWQLYLQTARIRTGQQIQAPGSISPEGWPQTLLALQAGTVDEGAVLAQADTPGRRAEALFQMAVLKSVADPAAARSRWQEVVEQGTHDLVEYAAARNELARTS